MKKKSLSNSKFRSCDLRVPNLSIYEPGALPLRHVAWIGVQMWWFWVMTPPLIGPRTAMTRAQNRIAVAGKGFSEHYTSLGGVRGPQQHT